MKHLQNVLFFFLFELCLTINFASSQRDNLHGDAKNILKLMGYQQGCITATFAACSVDCPHNINMAIWKAKQGISVISSHLNDVIGELSKVASCFPLDLTNIVPFDNGAPPVFNKYLAPPRDCMDILNSDHSRSGIFTIYYNPKKPSVSMEVFCDQETDGGGWIVIQRRINQHPRENFNRNWNDYKRGFGKKSGEFWLGLDNIHDLTKEDDMELRIDLEDAEGIKRFAHYKYFSVGNKTENYALRIGEYTPEGTAKDAMKFHNNQQFTTHDRDNDNDRLNCAMQYSGGWWYNNCLHSNLNGYQYIGKAQYSKGIVWFEWHGYQYSLAKVSMKIRRRKENNSILL